MRSRLLAAALAALTLAACEAPAPPAAVSHELRLTGLDGVSRTLERWRGKWLVVNVWASWCEPCRREMGALQHLSERVDPERAAVIGLTVDDDLQLAREYLRRAGVRFDNFADGPPPVARPVLGVNALPETIVLGPDGRVRARVVGARDWTDDALIARLGLPVREALAGGTAR
jgi:thiol-disulfide isomerase/thioredoxin